MRPIVPPKGKPIVTLADARAYALALPKARKSDPHVLAGVEAILMVAEGKACEFVAQSAVAHIVHGPVQPLNRPKRERPWMKRKSPG